MPIDLTPRNESGDAHGLWELYHPNGRLMVRCLFIEGNIHGLWTSYHEDGNMRDEGYYDMGKQIGFWIDIPLVKGPIEKIFYAN